MLSSRETRARVLEAARVDKNEKKGKKGDNEKWIILILKDKDIIQAQR